MRNKLVLWPWQLDLGRTVASNSTLPAGRPGFPQEKSQDQRRDDPVKQRFETGLVVRQGTADIPFRHLHQSRSEYWAEECAKSEIDKVDHSGSRIWCASYIGPRSHMVAVEICHPEIEHTRKSSRKAPKAICCFASKLALPSSGFHWTKVLFTDGRRLPILPSGCFKCSYPNTRLTPAPHVSRTENKLLWRCFR